MKYHIRKKMSLYKKSKSKNILSILEKRSLGMVKQTYSSSYDILGQIMFSSNRCWKLISSETSSGIMHFNEDTMLIVKNSRGPAALNSCEMRRFLSDKKKMTLYGFNFECSIKDLLIYDLVEPHYKKTSSRNAYKSAFIVLKNNNKLCRYDLLKGHLLNEFYLGSYKMQTLHWNTTQDELVVASGILRETSRSQRFVIVKIFSLEDFNFVTSFGISGNVFPNPAINDKDTDEVVRFGKLSSVEVEGSFLIVCTNKDYVFWYSMECIKKQIAGRIDKPVTSNCMPVFLEEAPAVLFSFYSFRGYSTIGGHPFMYITAPNSHLMQIHKVQTKEVVNGGLFPSDNLLEEVVLSFHVDDSNRLLFFQQSNFEILRIKNGPEEVSISKEFQFKEPHLKNSMELETITSSRGRRIKKVVSTCDFFNNPNHSVLAFAFEQDLNVMAILESVSVEDHYNMIELSNVIFYDSISYQQLGVLAVNQIITGNHETSKFSLYFDFDVLNIVVKNCGRSTYFSYRLQLATYRNQKN